MHVQCAWMCVGINNTCMKRMWYMFKEYELIIVSLLMYMLFFTGFFCIQLMYIHLLFFHPFNLILKAWNNLSFQSYHSPQNSPPNYVQDHILIDAVILLPGAKTCISSARISDGYLSKQPSSGRIFRGYSVDIRRNSGGDPLDGIWVLAPVCSWPTNYWVCLFVLCTTYRVFRKKNARFHYLCRFTYFYL